MANTAPDPGPDTAARILNAGGADPGAGSYADIQARFEDLKSRGTADWEARLFWAMALPVYVGFAGNLWLNFAGADDAEVWQGLLTSAAYWQRWGGPLLGTQVALMGLAGWWIWRLERTYQRRNPVEKSETKRVPASDDAVQDPGKPGSSTNPGGDALSVCPDQPARLEPGGPRVGSADVP